jgi:hypothetical protein
VCVCVYRCVNLKELAVSECCEITDVGMSNVITRCTQLRVLKLWGLVSITGMCSVCEDPELTLCFITSLSVIFTAGSSCITKAHH